MSDYDYKHENNSCENKDIFLENILKDLNCNNNSCSCIIWIILILCSEIYKTGYKDGCNDPCCHFHCHHKEEE